MTPLLLVGCGNMGSALLARWCNSLTHLFSPIHVVEPKEVVCGKNVSRVKQLSDLPKNFSPGIIILAVKPQQLADILPTLVRQFGSSPTYLSIAAGKKLDFYAQALGQGVQIVRAMPNTPAMIGQGVTALVGNAALGEKGRTHATQLMGAVGSTLWLESEDLMDAVTAISGSGPAYFFLFMECLVAAGVKHGLSQEVATALALNTCAGSAALALQSGASLADLRKQVTSPGGTTEAALAILQKNDGLHKLMEEATGAAVKRAREL